MSEKTKHGYDKCLKKKIGNVTLYLHKGWDLVHGNGWFAHSYHDDFKKGFGFHKKNKITAVRMALNVE